MTTRTWSAARTRTLANSDLYKFDHNASINLPDPPSFLKLNETGGTAMPAASGSTGWSVETSLDVEWAHAIAPQANIVLFEANSTYGCGFDNDGRQHGPQLAGSDGDLHEFWPQRRERRPLRGFGVQQRPPGTRA